MNWVFSAKELVTIPRLDAETGVAVGRALVSASKREKRLPRALSAAPRKMKQVVDGLARAARDRVPAEAMVDLDRATARREENAAWSALHQLMGAWSSILDASLVNQRDTAARIIDTIFDGGQTMARLTHHKAWARAEQRLALIEERGLEESIRELGGGAFLESARRAHKMYGAALGITGRKEHASEEAEGPTVKELLSELSAVIREYVVLVSAYAETSATAKQSAMRLLAPLAEWQQLSAKPRRRDAEAETEPPTNTPDATPTQPEVAPSEPPPAATPPLIR